MATLVAIALSAFLLEDVHLLAAFVLENFCANGRAIYERAAEFNGFAFADTEDGIDGHCVPVSRLRIAVYEQDIALLNGEFIGTSSRIPDSIGFLLIEPGKDPQIRNMVKDNRKSGSWKGNNAGTYAE